MFQPLHATDIVGVVVQFVEIDMVANAPCRMRVRTVSNVVEVGQMMDVFPFTAHGL